MRVEAVSPQTLTRHPGAFKEGGPAESREMDVSCRRPWSGSVSFQVAGKDIASAPEPEFCRRLKVNGRTPGCVRIGHRTENTP